jgi:hypothetical protein
MPFIKCVSPSVMMMIVTILIIFESITKSVTVIS